MKRKKAKKTNKKKRAVAKQPLFLSMVAYISLYDKSRSAFDLLIHLSDVLAYIVKPTGPFFPGFTINSILSGVIYGLTLKPDTDGNVSIKRIVISKLICTVLINMVLNTLWLSMLYGNAFKVLFFSRLPKEIIMFPVNTLLLIAVMKPMKKFFYQGVLN